MPRWRWVISQFSRRLWVRATLIGAMGVLAAILAAFAERYIPWQMPIEISADAVDSLLKIIASSMLAVTTFSLSVMVTAYGSATNSVSPRATKLLIEDRVTQTVLSTFIGSFLFGIVGLVVLKTGAYGDRGRAILFGVTVAVIVLVVVTLLRWVDHLTRLGRVGETTDRVEEAARKALQDRLAAPFLGGRPLLEAKAEIPADAVAVTASNTGYIQHIDMPALSKCCENFGTSVYVRTLPGAFVYPHTPVALIAAPTPDKDVEALVSGVRAAFSIRNDRSFDQDPRFGMAVMCEIASRALSPATNDSGTAIDIIGRTARLLSLWAREDRNGDGNDGGDIKHAKVFVPPLSADDLFEDAFMLIGRDGAGLVEVQLRLQKALLALGEMGDDAFRAAAARQARLALERSEIALTLETDKQRLRAIVAKSASPDPVKFN